MIDFSHITDNKLIHSLKSKGYIVKNMESQDSKIKEITKSLDGIEVKITDCKEERKQSEVKEQSEQSEETKLIELTPVEEIPKEKLISPEISGLLENSIVINLNDLKTFLFDITDPEGKLFLENIHPMINYGIKESMSLCCFGKNITYSATNKKTEIKELIFERTKHNLLFQSKLNSKDYSNLFVLLNNKDNLVLYRTSSEKYIELVNKNINKYEINDNIAKLKN
jgi:hypothetical protein